LIILIVKGVVHGLTIRKQHDAEVSTETCCISSEAYPPIRLYLAALRPPDDPLDFYRIEIVAAHQNIEREISSPPKRGRRKTLRLPIGHQSGGL